METMDCEESVYRSATDGMNLSLDEFIRKKKMQDQFGLLLAPKYKRDGSKAGFWGLLKKFLMQFSFQIKNS